MAENLRSAEHAGLTIPPTHRHNHPMLRRIAVHLMALAVLATLAIAPATHAHPATPDTHAAVHAHFESHLSGSHHSANGSSAGDADAADPADVDLFNMTSGARATFVAPVVASPALFDRAPATLLTLEPLQVRAHGPPAVSPDSPRGPPSV